MMKALEEGEGEERRSEKVMKAMEEDLSNP